MSSSSQAYYDVLARMWESGCGFVNVEQDVEIHGRVLRGFARCREPWCAFPYAGAGDPDGDNLLYTALGCTRFSTELLSAEPALMAELPVRNWQRLDCHIAPALQQRGYEPHVHRPAVKHHHRYRNRCACGGDHP